MRKDIYTGLLSLTSENISSSDDSPCHSQPLDQPQPPLANTVQEEDSADIPEQKAEVVKVRCDFCPDSEGLLELSEKIQHQAQHVPDMFSCAACCGKRKFPELEELVRHIHDLHSVTDGQMVLETILIPATKHGLKVFKCGVKNCEKRFVAQPESVLISHIVNSHGIYFVKVGKGKYILRLCRICGDEKTFSSEKELTEHISRDHPAEHFGEIIESDEDQLHLDIKQENIDHETEQASRIQSRVESYSQDFPKHTKEPTRASATSEELISQPGTSSTSKNKGRKKGKKSKHSSSSSSSSSSTSSSESSSECSEDERRRKKHKKRKLKNMKNSKDEKKFKKRIKSFSPDELKDYLKEMKNKKKLLKKKEKSGENEDTEPIHIPDPEISFPKVVNGKSSHFYCLICSQYVGKLPKWLQHRDSRSHVAKYSVTKGNALKKFKYTDIDMQECVMGERKFPSDPAGQCRECLDIFWSQTDHGSHLREGKCIKSGKERKKKTNATAPSILKEGEGVLEREPSRSPSPNIIWKPLPKPGDKGTKWKSIGETRTVIERSPSPGPDRRTEDTININLPKFMIDGKTAYFICKLCQIPVGNLLSWLEHKNKIEHRTKFMNSAVTDKMDQVIISDSLSVSAMFGGKCKKCLPCNLYFTTSEELVSHERLISHRIAVRSREIKDREELELDCKKFTTLYYCSLCSLSTCHSLSVHRNDPAHLQRLRETRQCNYCPLRLQSDLLSQHVATLHPHADFQCKKCPARFASGENLLEHAFLHVRKRVLSYEALLALDLILLPADLRYMEL